MSWVATAVVATVVGTQLYAADKQRTATNHQTDAIKAAQEADARQAAEAETGAAVAANAKLAEAKRRRRSSVLGMGDTTGTETLGGGAAATTVGGPARGSVLASGRTGGLGGGSAYGGTVLGAGSVASSGAAGGGSRSADRVAVR